MRSQEPVGEQHSGIGCEVGRPAFGSVVHRAGCRPLPLNEAPESQTVGIGALDGPAGQLSLDHRRVFHRPNHGHQPAVGLSRVASPTLRHLRLRQAQGGLSRDQEVCPHGSIAQRHRAVGPLSRCAQLLQLERPIGHPKRGAVDLLGGEVKRRDLPAALPDSLHPHPITACPRCPELKASAGAGGGSSPLLPAVIDQDQERLAQGRPVSLAYRAADDLLGQCFGASRKQSENCSNTAETLHLRVGGPVGVRVPRSS